MNVNFIIEVTNLWAGLGMACLIATGFIAVLIGLYVLIGYAIKWLMREIVVFKRMLEAKRVRH